MSSPKEELQKTRLKNLVYLLNAPKVGNGVIAKLAGKIDRQPAQTRFYLNPDEKWGRKMGESLARDIEEKLHLPKMWMDIDHDTVKEEKPEYIKDLFCQINRHVTQPLHLWTDYSKNLVKIDSGESANIVIEKSIQVSGNCYLLELDSGIFQELSEGSLLLVDPDRQPEKGNVIILAFDNEPPTLARYMPGFGELQIEPMERGFPASIALKDKQYTVHGVVVWVQPKGFEP